VGHGRRQHRAAVWQVAAQLGERASLSARELVRPRLGGRLAGPIVVVVASTTDGRERAREEDGGEYASAAHDRSEG
jgi:hypothetical protein